MLLLIPGRMAAPLYDLWYWQYHGTAKRSNTRSPIIRCLPARRLVGVPLLPKPQDSVADTGF